MDIIYDQSNSYQLNEYCYYHLRQGHYIRNYIIIGL